MFNKKMSGKKGSGKKSYDESVKARGVLVNTIILLIITLMIFVFEYLFLPENELRSIVGSLVIALLIMILYDLLKRSKLHFIKKEVKIETYKGRDYYIKVINGQINIEKDRTEVDGEFIEFLKKDHK